MKQGTKGSFRHWVNDHKRETIALGSIVSGANILIGIVSQLDDYKKFLISPWFPSIWYGIHLLLVLYLFWLTYKVSPKTSESYPKPSQSVWDFYYFLLALWVVWAILYSALAFRAFDERKLQSNRRNAAHDVIGKLNNRDVVSQKIHLEIDGTEDIGTISEAITLAGKYPAHSDEKAIDLAAAVKNFQSLKRAPNSRFWEFFGFWRFPDRRNSLT
jgi:hypothetical protein